MSLTHEELAEGLGISRVRVTQLVGGGMPVESLEAARAWRDARRADNQRAGHISQPVRPINLERLGEILESVEKRTDDDEMDGRISQQVALVDMTREVFESAVREGDPSQSKLYGNYDRAIATLLRLERERHIRLQERGRLVDADEATQRFGKVLGSLRSLIERAELTVAPAANPDNPTKALKAFRDFKDDLFRKVSEYAPQVEFTEGVAKPLPPVEEPPADAEDGFGVGTVGGVGGSDDDVKFEELLGDVGEVEDEGEGGDVSV
jgi:hypothetical protein